MDSIQSIYIPPSSGGDSLYTTNGTLSSHRTVTGANKRLDFTDLNEFDVALHGTDGTEFGLFPGELYLQVANNNVISWLNDIYNLTIGNDYVVTVAGTELFNYSGDSTTLSITAGLISLGGAAIQNVLDPQLPQDAATKSYVDSLAIGLKWKDLARLATTAALPANTVVGLTLVGTSTGVLTIDSQAVALNDRILVKNEALPAKNGIYLCTTAGAVGVAYILTRATDADTDAELTSAAIAIVEGTINANKAFTQTTSIPVVGTDPIVWAQFLNNAYSAGTGIRIASNILYSKLSEGVTGGQTVIGGTGADDTLTVQGSVSASARTSTAPAIIMNSGGVLGGSSGAQVFASIPFSVSSTGTAGWTGLKLAVTDTSTGSGIKNLIELLAGASGTTSKFAVDNSGNITQTGRNIGMVDSKSFNDISSSITGTTPYTLDFYAEYPYTINTLRIKSGSGTATAAIKINGTPVSGLSAVAVGIGGALGTAGANTVIVGDIVTLTLSSASGLSDLKGSLKITRT